MLSFDMANSSDSVEKVTFKEVLAHELYLQGTGACSVGTNNLGCEADHSSTSNAEVWGE